MDRLETIYNNVITRVFNIANPVKKSIKTTECKVHIFLNMYALDILLNDKYIKEYNFFHSYIDSINEGAVWADQDFKSSSHFYNPDKKRGLYGRKSAMDLTTEYYNKAINLWRYGDKKKSMFYLGASIHIVQDMTVPQHANVRLLDDHHQYETYVKRTYNYIEGFKVKTGAYMLDTIEDYIRFNTRVALKIHKKFRKIKHDETRYYRITRCSLPLAKRTTAGALIMFYNQISKESKSKPSNSDN